VEVPVSGFAVVPVLLPALPVPVVPADEPLPDVPVPVEVLPEAPMPELLPEAPVPAPAPMPAPELVVQVLDTFFTRLTLMVWPAEALELELLLELVPELLMPEEDEGLPSMRTSCPTCLLSCELSP
jgi:hypothetical protein